MNSFNVGTTDHDEAWDLLPWLVNGRLEGSEKRRTEAHLRVCGQCREEFGRQRIIHDVVARHVSQVEKMPIAGLNKLRQRIAGTQSDTVTEQANQRRSERRMSWRRAAAVVAAVAVAVAAVLAARYMPPGSQRKGAAYYTVTTDSPRSPDAAIRAVFAPTTTVAELQALLDECHLRIVSGPTDAGVYALAQTDANSLDWSLHRLRAHDTVRFAEAVAP